MELKAFAICPRCSDLYPSHSWCRTCDPDQRANSEQEVAATATLEQFSFDHEPTRRPSASKKVGGGSLTALGLMAVGVLSVVAALAIQV